MSGRSAILIVGGYGQVGREVARLLAPRFPGAVIIAGRDRAKAEALATRLGHGTRAMGLSLPLRGEPPPLKGVGLVVMCLDPETLDLAECCLAAGVDYIDVTAKQESLDALERLEPLARRSGATAVLGVGVAPGLTNLLAARAHAGFEHVERMDLFLMLGGGDAHGAAAIGWTLDNLDRVFTVQQDGRPHEVRSFREHEVVRFPGLPRTRKAWRFNFPDQRMVARAFSIPSVSTWLCFDSALLTAGMRLAARVGLSWLLRVPALRRGVMRVLGACRLGSDVCRVLVRAEGRLGGHPATREFAFEGRREAELTALVAAEAARWLLAGHRPGGVLALERFVTPGPFLRRLEESRPGLQLWMGSV
ncbi:saccharopine dehydrogenase family protein [Cystobacter ferrugineus]|uniref:Saccharopine dehydrogenase NADP binding domain-containing protein n=1 Tax=Cystobacter ferrugineus TaxID=83449 RepID=A0A1L9AZD7_9BACT|nr:saccharopine dehydrogenase NADP-binding domain-containing protein [Cystobacter ferrugineus]OJH35273.1 hypothetical protein BON30_40210 [Cystobacter ferrugineus]